MTKAEWIILESSFFCELSGEASCRQLSELMNIFQVSSLGRRRPTQRAHRQPVRARLQARRTVPAALRREAASSPGRGLRVRAVKH